MFPMQTNSTLAKNNYWTAVPGADAGAARAAPKCLAQHKFAAKAVLLTAMIERANESSVNPSSNRMSNTANERGQAVGVEPGAMSWYR
jgi:hypothetical protein